jgi:hypothetical protein
LKHTLLALFIVFVTGATLRAQAPATGSSETSTASSQEDKKTAFSLRPDFEKFGLKPRSQGYYACVVFATLGVLELDYAKAGAPVRFSEQFAEWASVKAAGKRYLNFPYKTVIKGIQKFGVCTEELMPYTDARQDLGEPSSAALKDAATHRRVNVTTFHDYNRDFGFKDSEIKAMCNSIAAEKALVCILRWPKEVSPTFKKTFTIDTQHSEANLSSTEGVVGHAVVFLGYEKGPQWEGGGRFEFRNSFGEKWGQSGYGWVTFEYLKKHGVAAYAVHRSR